MAELATVRQLRPVRVLVGGSDAAFVARATSELASLGFDVMSTNAIDRVAELASQQHVNVVLLDASGGVTSAAAIASALDALPQPVHVLLAGGRSRATARLGYDFVHHAASGQELAAAVHRAYAEGPHKTGRVRRR